MNIHSLTAARGFHRRSNATGNPHTDTCLSRCSGTEAGCNGAEPTSAPACSAILQNHFTNLKRDTVHLLRKFCLALSLLAAGALPALASVTVSTPANGAQVVPQFTLSATADSCSNQAVSAMGFSLDSSSNTTIVNGASLNATVTATTGAHTLHVKAWGNQGAACVTDVAITVSATSGVSNGVSVTAPGSGATVTSPFAVTADALTCSSQPVSAMGYSIDTGSTAIVNATAISASATTTVGAHTLHVKAWGKQGAVCVSDVPITVTAQSATTSSTSSTSTSNGVTVTSPASGASVGSPFTLNAAATDCSSQPVSAMGYSLDSSTNTAIVNSTSIAASVTASAGAHTLHVKSWGNSGASCVANVAINVSGSSTATGGLIIASPAAGASVASPFTLQANASTCSSQAVTSIGYAVDGNSSTIATGASLNTQISAAAGTHTVYVTAWGSGGVSCTASVAIDVAQPSLPATSVIPSNAISVSSIQTLNSWLAQHDPGAGASSSGTMAMVSSPSLSGNARQFNTTYSNYGGEIYHATFGDDTSSSHFFYDTWVYLTSSASNIANLEMDMNQVMPNGQTVIYGFQCDGWSGTWDYTENAGTPSIPVDEWVHSAAACNMRNWSANAWHHVQVTYSRDDAGNVTYHSVWLDGVESDLEATVPSAFALGWSPVLLTNVQVDGLDSGSGSNTVYIDQLTISRW